MKKVFIIAFATTLFLSCTKEGDNDADYPGFIYTSTNASTGNAIIAVGREVDGSLKELKGSPYMTGSAGDAAEGDFDTEWALRIVGDYLLTVNAGNNPVNSSISVFKINRNDGSLKQVDQNPETSVMDNIDSRGVRSVSIASKVINGVSWVLVGNQYANPNYQKSPAKAYGFPVVSTPLRNVAVFKFDQSNGLLQYQSIGATYMDGTNGGPCTVDFNSSGTKVAVSTWGITHFDTPDADLNLQKPSRLYVYSFLNGTLNQTGMYEEIGVSGSIGLSWSPNDNYIYLTNFNLHSSKEANSVTVHDGTSAAKIQNFATSDRNDEACWALVSLDKRKFYSASFTSNDVSVFDIGTDNKLAVPFSPNFVHRRGVPPQDTKDMYETAGYLYVSGAFKSHSISTFLRNPATGALLENYASPYVIPSSIGKTNDQQAFLGLTGFDKFGSY
jgi:6-phosphogluconolactonase (cycloisomerase 2 family)